MSANGLRSRLQPVLYVGAAALIHGLLFLVPGGGGKTKPEATTVRGVRVRAYVETPSAPVAAPLTRPVPRAVQPEAPRAPSPASNVKAPVAASGETPAPGADPAGATGGASAGSPGGSGAPDGGTGDGPAPQSEFGQYLARLKSQDVQGWAKESARSMRKGWKGSADGAGGWGPGGGGTGTGSGAGGGGRSAGKGGGQGVGGGGYLDPRVKMVVNSFPRTGIESRYTPVAYPDVKIKKNQYTSGWWNVYIEIRTDAAGKVTRYEILRPETRGTLEKIFLEQVQREVSRWTYDPVEAEIHVDVRFYVE